MSYNKTDFELEQLVRSRLTASMDYYADREIPEYELWMVLTRYDQALGHKNMRYTVMRWMFPGKWTAEEQPSGNDLTPLELHVMSKWADPQRIREFEQEVHAVHRICVAEIDTPVADQAVIELTNTLHQYPMRCGHTNDDYTLDRKPICTACFADAITDQEKQDSMTVDELMMKEGL